MGMFNSIYHDLLCPKKRKTGKDTEIQIKWQLLHARTLNVYRRGDILEDIEAEYNNNWIRADYICKVCSKFSRAHYGGPYIKVNDQKRHYVFVQIKNSKIREIFTAREFRLRQVKKFINYW